MRGRGRGYLLVVRRLDEVYLEHADHAAPLTRGRLVHLVRGGGRARARARARVRARLRVGVRVRASCTPPTWA